ncbi:M48 family metallopeptidase [Altererythrobacter lutimaris]|uniref:M48 family metallopeptidase n=1 Tax=Altererythrobacter lutimaris TaxID=2743979 RepID=A0A850HDR9_9SPHN|nr:SprT family zinc-dependent metalloprotease [Altererythrobacter lutimaris]NVE94908.1 M48 family metallopeptidase [Altererythrobacter lutimaris]
MIDWLRKEQLEPEIELAGRVLPIELKRHPRARRLTLRIAPDGSAVRLTLPQWARSAEAIAFAHAKTEWLAIQLDKLPQRTSPEPGGTLQLHGEPHAIEWDQTHPRTPRLEHDTIMLGGPLSSLEARLRRWCETRALATFEDDVTHYCETAGLEPVPVALSRAQKRWGSCSDRKRIRLNWRLIQAPDLVRRSVVAHEVTHLVHFDHSPAFHAMLGELFEGNVREADRWLKQHGRGLYASFG